MTNLIHKLFLTVFALIAFISIFMLTAFAFPAETAEIALPVDCFYQTPETEAYCKAQEKQILDSTLRLEIDRGRIWLDGSGYINFWGGGHGTVKDGRYFMTHWHYNVNHHNMFPKGTFDEIATFTLYRPDGTVLISVKDAPLSISALYGETVILDFGTQNGIRFFDAIGVPSAPFIADAGRVIRPNQTVARINWDEKITFVEWTRIQSVTSEDGVAIIELENGIVIGSSGGGIFFDGQHIANNWKVVRAPRTADEIVNNPFSVAALNMPLASE